MSASPSVVQTIRAATTHQLQMLRTHPFAAAFIAATFAVSEYVGYHDERVLQANGYLLAVVFSAFVADFFLCRFPEPIAEFPIKRRLSTEVFVILLCVALCMVSLVLYLGLSWHIVPLLRMAAVLFAFPIALALLYFIAFQYKPRELGINLRFWYLPLAVLSIFGAITLAVAPGGMAWSKFTFLGWLFSALISAASSEEFLRMLLQTRLGRACNSKAFGLVAATFVWGCLHMPHNFKYSGGSYNRMVLESITIMPEGFLWGYITYRTKSLLPAICMHACNLWGIVNF